MIMLNRKLVTYPAQTAGSAEFTDKGVHTFPKDICPKVKGVTF